MRKAVSLMIALATIFSVSGCGLLDWIFPEKTPEIPADHGYEDTPKPPTGSSGKVRESTLYVLDTQTRFVLPINYDIPWEEGIAKAVISHLVDGGPAHQFLATRGLKGVLPAGTRVLGMSVKEGVAIVDFNEELLNTVDANQERLLLDALTYTLTEFSNIDKVTLWVNRQPLIKMSHGTPVASELSRERGINTQVSSKGSGLTVTIYLTMDNAAGGLMLVPVTRVVPPAATMCTAALEQLIGGPGPGEYGLTRVMPATVQLQNISVEGGIAAVDFSEDLVQTKNIGAAVAAIVLTLTEVPEVTGVKLTVQGQPISLRDGKSLVDPVMRPPTINPLAF